MAHTSAVPVRPDPLKSHRIETTYGHAALTAPDPLPGQHTLPSIGRSIGATGNIQGVYVPSQIRRNILPRFDVPPCRVVQRLLVRSVHFVSHSACNYFAHRDLSDT